MGTSLSKGKLWYNFKSWDEVMELLKFISKEGIKATWNDFSPILEWSNIRKVEKEYNDWDGFGLALRNGVMVSAHKNQFLDTDGDIVPALLSHYEFINLKKSTSMNPETTSAEEVFFEPNANEELSMELYKTTEGNFIAKRNNEEFLYDKDGNPFTGTVESFGQPATKVRRDSAIFKKLSSNVDKKEKKEENYVKVTELMGFDVLLDKKTISMVIDVNGEMVGIDKDGMEKIQSQMGNFEKIKTTLSAANTGYKTSDRVLLYGPTGSGKTYDFLSTVTQMQKDSKIDTFDIVTITDGMEDIDFIAHIFPTAKGLEYKENKVVGLLREAAAGKKVAILLDELNRGSKSFLNLILKLLDAVDGETYTLNNFVKNEAIVIPIENVLFFATMNLGGKYVGTNALDEALFDRFSIVQYKGYNTDIEDDILKHFGSYSANVKSIITYIRDLHKEGEIRSPISTRGIKGWAETFLNSSKSKDDVLSSFQRAILYRLISVDDFGNPNQEEIAIIMKKFKDLGLMGA